MIEARKDRRAPASLKVKYKSETVDALVEQLAGDVSRAGIFIKTKKPLEPGSLLKFEFQLQDGEPVIYGVGRVAWCRTEQAARPSFPPGMGIKFIKLNGDSRSVIERIEAKHGAGSRYEQTEGAQIAPSISSLPPDHGSSEPEEPSISKRPISSSPPLREARVSNLKASPATAPSFRAPPPASSSVPPSRSAASLAPRGALGAAGASRRAPAARSTARDASEFLATAFSVGGAGREVRSEAHAQAERARQDPRAVDLANELFGDLSEGTKSEAAAALDADPVLGKLTLGGADAPAADPPGRQSLDDLVNDPSLNARAARSNRPPAAVSQIPLDHLSLSLQKGSNEHQARGSTGNGRVLWGVAAGLLLVAGGVAVFSLQRPPPPAAIAAHKPAPGSTQVPALPAPTGPNADPPGAVPPAPISVDWSISSEPAGAEVTLDGQASGTTPLVLKLTQGQTVELKLHSAGFVVHSESVTVANTMSPRSVTLSPLPYELVVTEPEGAIVKVGDLSTETPAPLELGQLADGVATVTVTIEKPGFQRLTRKLARADFHEEQDARRAQLSVTLTPIAGQQRRAAPRPAPRVAPAAPAPELQAPPEPEANAPARETKPVVAAKAPEPAATPLTAATPSATAQAATAAAAPAAPPAATP